MFMTISTTATSRPATAGFDARQPFGRRSGVLTGAWVPAPHIAPMSALDRTVRFVVNQASPPREVILR
jgi:hypothetical protein